MPDGRYDELERLQRLRESGALTDAEFQGEKRRLLGHETVPSEQPVPEAEAEAEPVSRRPLYIIIGLAALAVAVAAGLWLGNLVGGGGTGESGNAVAVEENVAQDTNLIEAKTAAPDVRTLPAQEQLDRAFLAAFGTHGDALLKVDAEQTEKYTEDVHYTPGRLIWPGFGPVLLSEGKVEDGPHVSAGRIAIHYLKPVGDGFEVVHSYPNGVHTGSSGQVADWSVSPRFSDWPMVLTEGGGMWQGYGCSWLTLTELRPGGPMEMATVPLSYDDSGAKGDEGATTIEGKILNVVRNQSFDIVYSGSRAFGEHYVRSGDRYSVAGGKSSMETC
jgi:hypothetical protein